MPLAIGQVVSLFSTCSDRMTLAAKLGGLCLDNETEIRAARSRNTRANELVLKLQKIVTDSRIDWKAIEDDDGEGLSSTLKDRELRETLEMAEAIPGIAAWGVLLGMARTCLVRYYDTTRSSETLLRGVPFPLVERRVTDQISQPTPRPLTLASGSLLGETGFRLFTGSRQGIECQLDFGPRCELDKATWIEDEDGQKFPLMASIHPYERPEQITVDYVDDDYWFGVHPVAFDEQEILAQLTSAKEAGVGCAVIPELSLDEVDALGAQLSSQPERFPDVVVAGSAHRIEEDSSGNQVLRVNESWTYLRGEKVLEHRKIHPYSTDYLGEDVALDKKLPEGITGEPKKLVVLSGSKTRMAVVICADLNDQAIPFLLEELCVNLLFVPAMSGHAGAFNGTAASLASQCQGVTVICNGAPSIRPGTSPPPFMTLVGVPQAASADQTAEFPEPDSGRRQVGVIDPNLPSASSLTWVGN